MPWKERMTWVYGASVLLTYGVYVALIVPRLADRPVEGVPYAAALLLSILASVLTTVAGTIVFAILGARSDPEGIDRSDERDFEIDHRGERAGYLVFSIGILGPLGLSMAEQPHFWVANAIYLAYVIAALVSTGVKLVAYRRGF